jgi:hypothetical protein
LMRDGIAQWEHEKDSAPSWGSMLLEVMFWIPQLTGCGLTGPFESRCAQQGRRRRERMDHRSKERTGTG